MTGPAEARGRIVLWDIDQTLIDVVGVTQDAYAAAFRRLVGRPLEHPWQFNGRTELAAVTEVLTMRGTRPSPESVESFLALLEEEMHERAALIRSGGRVLDGAEAALAAVADLPDTRQSVLTGNLRSLAELKLRCFGLEQYLDLRIGAFGGDDVDRVDLPEHALRRARRLTGTHMTGADLVIVGDTPLDVAAAAHVGARAIGVATGPYSVAQLRAAGAHHVLSSLASTAEVLGVLQSYEPQPSAVRR